MLGRVFGIICILSLVFSLITGNTSGLSNAVLDGATQAVELVLTLTGIMCLWCGIMQVFEDAGLVKRLTRLMSPLLRVFFPTAYRTKNGAEEIAANISANLLGLGNAATPLAIRAMQKMQTSNPDPTGASDDMITLAVLNTASVSILPSTIIALRRAAGAAQPYLVVVPVWICSALSALFALLLSRAAAVAGRPARRRAKSAGKIAAAPGKAVGNMVSGAAPAASGGRGGER
ncbi:MAG TPA: spore maturation protein A [Clostridiales bacterium]|jgi:spore maturation protein A|nr:spore maturation protein A [Clostridiales bacterium]